MAQDCWHPFTSTSILRDRPVCHVYVKWDATFKLYYIIITLKGYMKNYLHMGTFKSCYCFLLQKGKELIDSTGN